MLSWVRAPSATPPVSNKKPTSLRWAFCLMVRQTRIVFDAVRQGTGLIKQSAVLFGRSSTHHHGTATSFCAMKASALARSAVVPTMMSWFLLTKVVPAAVVGTSTV